MIDFGIKDIIDILLVALLLYYVYRLMKESGTINIFYGVMAFTILWFFASEIFDKRLIGKRLDKFMGIVYACMSMSKSKTGALIVIEQTIPLDDYEKTGDIIDARINTRLIENIFFKNSPLHDGALIVAHGRLVSAGCILPVSHDSDVHWA